MKKNKLEGIKPTPKKKSFLRRLFGFPSEDEIYYEHELINHNEN
jgi:hypothetical protein